jgi:FPC/CPF motif-containing protein YcgG
VHLPQLLTQLYFPDCRKRDITISWNSPENNGAKISRYLLFLREPDTELKRNDQTGDGDDGPEDNVEADNDIPKDAGMFACRMLFVTCYVHSYSSVRKIYSFLYHCCRRIAALRGNG